jgi:putative ABC transport system permease protein
MQLVGPDLRSALRQFAKRPGLTLLTVGTLGLAVGFVSSMFSLVNALVLAPLPFEDEQQLVRLVDIRRRDDGSMSEVSFSQRNFHAVRDEATSFEAVVAQMYVNLNVRLGDTPEQVAGIRVSEGWLKALGVEPALGRDFSGDEQAQGSDGRATLISHGFWERHLGADPSAVGRNITVEGQQYYVVGVLPKSFNYPYEADVWIPWSFDRDNGRTHGLNVQARMKPGVRIAQAQAELDALSERLATAYPDTNAGWGQRAKPLRDTLVQDHTQMAMILLVSVAFFVLIACANVGSVLLARSLGRQREFAVRAALGASRRRLALQLFAESVLLALCGGAVGSLLAYWIQGSLRALIPPALGYVTDEVRVDATVLGFALLVSLAVATLVALGPALRATSANPQSLLTEGGRAATSGRAVRLLGALAAVEIALSLVLLAGAGVMATNVSRLGRADLGFEPSDLLSLKTALPEARYAEPARHIAFVQSAVEQLASVPGVTSAAATNYFPLNSENRLASIALEGRETAPDEHFVVNHRIVSPGFFETLGLPLLRGRAVGTEDTPDAQRVVVVNKALADRYWPGEVPIGRRVRIANRDGAEWLTVVGVVGNVVEPRLSGDIRETWYLPYAQGFENDRSYTSSRVVFAVRTSVDTETIVPALRRAIWQVEGAAPVFDVIATEELRGETLADKRIAATLLACFSAFALLLSALGTYGVMSYAVSLRLREIAIRMALGATSRDMAAMVLRWGIAVVVSGTLVGLGAAAALAPQLRSVVTEISPLDPATIGIVTVALASVALLACLAPVRRAVRVNPTEALKDEG